MASFQDLVPKCFTLSASHTPTFVFICSYRKSMSKGDLILMNKKKKPLMNKDAYSPLPNFVVYLHTNRLYQFEGIYGFLWFPNATMVNNWGNFFLAQVWCSWNSCIPCISFCNTLRFYEATEFVCNPFLLEGISYFILLLRAWALPSSQVLQGNGTSWLCCQCCRCEQAHPTQRKDMVVGNPSFGFSFFLSSVAWGWEMFFNPRICNNWVMIVLLSMVFITRISSQHCWRWLQEP